MTGITMRVLILLLALAAPAAAKPVFTWVSATEGYFTLPLGSQVRYPDNNQSPAGKAACPHFRCAGFI